MAASCSSAYVLATDRVVDELPLYAIDYGFEYSDEEVEEEDVDIENQYYNSKGMSPPEGAVFETPRCYKVSKFFRR